jgi:hypothetical protein
VPYQFEFLVYDFSNKEFLLLCVLEHVFRHDMVLVLKMKDCRGGANGSLRFKVELGHGANAGLEGFLNNVLKPVMVWDT